MGPPTEMGPPPLPPQAGATTANSSKPPKDNHDVAEKYRRLKKRYFELEDRHKDAVLELRRSGERTVAWMNEKSALLERIDELTSAQLSPEQTLPSPALNAYPRSLLNPRNQREFIRNLDIGIVEAENESLDLDPLQHSRHVGPQARRMQEAEVRERQEEEAREARRANKRPRAGTRSKDPLPPPIPSPQPPPPQPQLVQQQNSLPSSHQMIVPMPSPNHVLSPGHGPMQSPPVPVSNAGTRLRVMPAPARPSPGDISPVPSSSSVVTTSAAPPPPPSITTQHDRSESPHSPMQIQEDEYMRGPTMVTLSPAVQYRQTPMDPAKAAQSQMQMTLRPSSGIGGLGRPSEMQRHTKPKRLKAHTVTTKSFSIPVVPRDKNHSPMLPLNVGIMTVLNLGSICMREHFHTERYIFPIGYEVTRRYLSTVDPNAEVVYNCKIMDGGDGPKFQIIAADVPESPFTAGTATGAWSVVVRSANSIRNRQHSNSVSGPDFFGLGQNTIKHLIQELPGADMLKDYVWQKFVEGGPLGGRHAAVIPALPEDHESTIMYAPVTPAPGNDPPTPVITTPPIANNGNGAPSHYYTEHGELVELDRPRELQIIHVDTDDLQTGTNHAHDGRVRHRSTHALSQGAPATMTSTIKPIMFHQEYPMAPPAAGSQGQGQTQAQELQQGQERAASSSGGRERRNSRASNPSYDEYSPNGGAASPSSYRDRPPPRSPLLHRDQQAAYSPRQGQASPYMSHNGGSREGDVERERGYAASSPAATQAAGVPATFASIMNAYPPGSTAERERSREREYAARHENGQGRGGGGVERSPEYAYANGR
ncbi:hypothetical protein BXZ70DRAFT_887891 [Cristinia sonorae]|uniref:Transforming growth factor beta regulator 1 n=1 Tax=Cristinia sonorae TaxID=1940300 RepID=A0A8K0XT39_9AGAR|nr:hypothetical protein BXZ70DRAFT_887891 [Cristinia sonorae]